MSSELRIPANPRRVRCTELPTADRRGTFGIEPQVRQAVEQDTERHAREVSAEPSAEAEVVADAERHVRSLSPMDVEPVGFHEPARVAVRARQHGGDQRALLELGAGNLDRLRRLPGRRPDRSGPPQCLLDGRLDQRTIFANLRELFRTRSQCPDDERDQVARFLQAAGEHQLRVRDDLVA